MSSSKIDTQGMSAPATPEDIERFKKQPQNYKPMVVTPRRLFTQEYVKEMSILINEVLDEREGKMDYASYFDTQHFRHTVNEEEPRYK